MKALDYIFANPVFTGSRFKKEAGIPTATAASMPKKMMQEGLISLIRQGQGRRPAYYRFDSLMDIVRR